MGEEFVDAPYHSSSTTASKTASSLTFGAPTANISVSSMVWQKVWDPLPDGVVEAASPLTYLRNRGAIELVDEATASIPFLKRIPIPFRTPREIKRLS